MRSITRKDQLIAELNVCRAVYETAGLSAFIKALNERILSAKVKFPVLERAAALICDFIPPEEHISCCNSISALHTIGGNVLIGIILQKKMADDFTTALGNAALYIEAGEEWYVTDIIGERVYGVGLLRQPEKTIAFLHVLKNHTSHWVVRSIGAGAHYAIKKGLPAAHVDTLFQLLLSLGDAKNFHIKTGIGWAAKTTAKFHPQIIRRYEREIADETAVGQWFRTKVRIGLERHAYIQAKRG